MAGGQDLEQARLAGAHLYAPGTHPTLDPWEDANGQLSIPVPGERSHAYGQPMEDAIERLTRIGSVAPDCPTCIRAIRTMRQTGYLPMGPAHRAKDGCLSGKRPHCTCDTCF